MKLKNVVTILLLMVAGLQTVKAQKIILHMSDNQKVEYEISQLDSITFDDGVYLTCPDDHHPHAIDLGLPSGTKWCCCNVGASTPEGYGGYYAWGETSEKSVYDDVTYKYCSGEDTNGDGWYDTDENYINIGSDIAGTSYDVARVRMGAPWHMPSTVQQQELINNCSYQTRLLKNGVYGILVTGRNGGQIFLPAAGIRFQYEVEYARNCGYYWSSSLRPDYDSTAYQLYFSGGNWKWYSWWGRYMGHTVRAVRP